MKHTCFYVLLVVLCGMMSSCGERVAKTLVLNEICGKEFPDNDWIEIYNPSDSVVQLAGVYIIKIDENGIDHMAYQFKSGSLAPGEVCVVSKMEERGLKRNISNKKEMGIELVGPNNETLDEFYRDDQVGEHSHPINGSYARLPNGTGEWFIARQASKGEINPEDTEVVDYELGDTDPDEENVEEEE